MITNLPKQFPLGKLESFTMGDVEPESDSLLDRTLGICMIHPVTEFLKGKKSLIVGSRGTGKTTIFKLVSKGKLKFIKKKNCRDIILAIDESLDYVEIKGRVFELFDTPIKDETVKCRYFWEIYILFRILIKIEEEFSNLSEVLKGYLKHFKIMLGYEGQEKSIKEMMSRLKLTGGLKFAQSYVGPTVTPQLSLESGDSSVASENQKGVNFNLEACKKDTNSFLESNKVRFFVLLDNLDEFVVKEAYVYQKLFIQGLLECESSYICYGNIKLKLFLRSDLFDRLDFESLGAEKVLSRKINLLWNDSDIRQLIAQRVILNYLDIFNLGYIELRIDKEKLYLDELSALEIERKSKNKIDSKFKKFIFRVFFLENKHLKKLINRLVGKFRKDDARHGRHTNFSDEINKEIITSIFPRVIKHRTSAGKNEDCDFLEFCSSHLCLSKRLLTPRIVIMFIEKCLECTRNYYKDNPDVKVVALDERNEYPLVTNRCISFSYDQFREGLLDSFYLNIPNLWKQFFSSLRAKSSAKFKFQFKELEKILRFNDTEQLRQFIAFLCHMGVLENTNPSDILSERNYVLPIVLRK